MENNRDRDIKDNTEKLCDACYYGDIEVVEDILSNKEVDINDGDYHSDTPLIAAVMRGHLAIVRRIPSNNIESMR